MFRTPENAIVIGLSGGIATGKSTALALLERIGNATVINADLLGHEAYKPGTTCLEQLIQHFGVGILSEDGTVNRAALGPIVFADPEQMKSLNSILWPSIRQLLKQQIRASTESDPGVSFIVVEAAVLIEAGWVDIVDEVWVTLSSHEKQKMRLMSRNNLTAQDAETRIKSQISNEERIQVAHVRIWNDDDTAALEKTMNDEIQKLKSRYASPAAMEQVDIVDEHDQVVSSAKRATAYSFNMIIRCSFVVLIHKPTGQVYVQRRSKTKAVGPGVLDPAPGGVVGAKESYQANATREMAEEMGIRGVSFEPIGALWIDDGKNRCWGHIFTAEISTSVENLILQDSEVQNVCLMSVADILNGDESLYLNDGLAAFKHFCKLKNALS